MTTREFLTVPNPKLREKSKPVKSIDGAIKELAAFMQKWVAESMPQAWGSWTISGALGITAPQFGELVRVIVLSDRGLDRVLVNPEVVYQKGKQKFNEACFSLPGKLYLVERPKIVKVRYIDINGEQRSIKGHGLTARALMHEINHLDGVLIDSIGSLL